MEKGLAEWARARTMTRLGRGQMDRRIEIKGMLPVRTGMVQGVCEGRPEVEQEEQQQPGGASAPDDRRGKVHARALARTGRFFFAHVSQRP
jgi:hypothetical protein